MCVNGDHRPPALPFPGPAPNSCRNKNGFLGCQVREALWHQTLLRESTLVPLTKAETLLCVCVCSCWVDVCTWVWLKRRVAGKASL